MCARGSGDSRAGDSPPLEDGLRERQENGNRDDGGAGRAGDGPRGRPGGLRQSLLVGLVDHVAHVVGVHGFLGGLDRAAAAAATRRRHLPRGGAERRPLHGVPPASPLAARRRRSSGPSAAALARSPVVLPFRRCKNTTFFFINL